MSAKDVLSRFGIALWYGISMSVPEQSVWFQLTWLGLHLTAIVVIVVRLYVLDRRIKQQIQGDSNDVH